MVPIDLTRGKNGLILDRYEKVETTDDGIIRGFRDGLWVPLYKVSLVSVPNPSGLAAIDDTPYRLETEASGLRTNAPEGVKLYSERVEKSNVNLKLSSYEYQKLRNNVTLANSLQRSNAQLLQQFQQLLNS
jgi:flagellar hook protein FlgE